MNQNKLKITIVLYFCSGLLFANAGSAIVWFGILHCLFLNLVIGIFESYYLKKRGILNRMWLIIIGNYFSMFIGLYFIAPYFSAVAGNLDFWAMKTSYGHYEVKGFIFGMLASFISTLILEFPFFYLSMKDKTKIKEFTWKYVEANSISNIIMFLIYLLIILQ